jgi:hypothetical protein
MLKIARKETRDHGLWGLLLTDGFLYQVQKGFRGERLGEKRDAKISCGVPQYLVSKCRDQDYLVPGDCSFKPSASSVPITTGMRTSKMKRS